MRSLLPDWLVPMAATLTDERFTADDWVFERKFDGIRLLAFKDGSDVRLFSRNRLLQNIPALASAIAGLPVCGVILDGEITWDREAAYHVFDILWLDGRSVTALPLGGRRALLAALPLRHPMQLVERLESEKPWDQALREGWEGVIAKRRDSPYEHKRSKHWLKMKCETTAELVVGGFTDPQGARVGLGALLVGHFDKGDLVFAGKIGTGFDTRLLLSLRPACPIIVAAALGLSVACHPGPVIGGGPKAPADGTIAGIVSTEGKAPVAGRKVTAANTATGTKFDVTTGPNGGYTIKLPAGPQFAEALSDQPPLTEPVCRRVGRRGPMRPWRAHPKKRHGTRPGPSRHRPPAQPPPPGPSGGSGRSR